MWRICNRQSPRETAVCHRLVGRAVTRSTILQKRARRPHTITNRTMRSAIVAMRPWALQAVANKKCTTVYFLRKLLVAITSVLAISSSYPAAFGPDYRSGHYVLSVVDLPFEAMSIASSVHNCPDLDALCGSSGIINIGVWDKHVVLKYKWLVRYRSQAHLHRPLMNPK